MELTILGSGNFIPSLKRGFPGYLLKADKKNFVLDFGPGTLNKLLKCGVIDKQFKN